MKSWTEMEARERAELVLSTFLEPKPSPVLLSELREYRDWHYSSAYAVSVGGDWKCEIGTDAGESTEHCEWTPAFDYNDDAEWLVTAFAIVEKMRGEGWVVDLKNGNGHAAEWECVFKDGLTRREAFHSSLPLAISEAALHAKGVEV